MNKVEGHDSGPFPPFTRLCWSDEQLVHAEGLYLVSHAPPSLRIPILVGVRLRFTATDVLLQANDDDSIRVTTDASEVTDSPIEIRSLSDQEPWRHAIGLTLMWSWKMTNQRGYFDGVQLEFAESTERPATRIQLICVASELKQQKLDARI